MRLPLYQVDAFTDRVFAGNPAAVVPLEAWLPTDTLQAIAAENNLAETAFFVPDGDGWLLRWFTPVLEVDLCGHATLASAFVISTILRPGTGQMSFRTEKAGSLSVTRSGDIFTLDFPSWVPKPVAVPDTLIPALGGPKPRNVLAARDFVVVYETAEQVAALAPNFDALAQLDRKVIVTAPGTGGTDFVSRFFAPGAGIAEDPVTGSAHCSLIPYWAEQLGKSDLATRQISERGGDLTCGLRGDRVLIGGNAVLYLEGFIRV